eukprot:1161601-Pelagomonas_calceolata.AAC.3
MMHPSRTAGPRTCRVGCLYSVRDLHRGSRCTLKEQTKAHLQDGVPIQCTQPARTRGLFLMCLGGAGAGDALARYRPNQEIERYGLGGTDKIRRLQGADGDRRLRIGRASAP